MRLITANCVVARQDSWQAGAAHRRPERLRRAGSAAGPRRHSTPARVASGTVSFSHVTCVRACGRDCAACAHVCAGPLQRKRPSPPGRCRHAITPQAVRSGSSQRRQEVAPALGENSCVADAGASAEVLSGVEATSRSCQQHRPVAHVARHRRRLLEPAGLRVARDPARRRTGTACVTWSTSAG